MRTAIRVLGYAGALAFVASSAAAQTNSNDSPLNNGGDVVFIYSSPSLGFSSLAFPPDVTGDLYWRSHPGSGFMNDVDPGLGSAMEIDGYYESLFDTNWGTSPSFYVRMHGPALPDVGGLGNLEPSFFQVGLGGGAYGETVVLVGPSGFGNPCTIAPSLCSPSGGTCPPPGFVNGYLVDLQFGSTPGSGIVLPADGTAASDMATTYFVTGGMTATGGACGLGDYDLQDVHSTNETQADPTGNTINPSGGFQIGGSGAVPDALNSMLEGHEAWRGNIVNVQANSGGGMGVEIGDNGGGAMNGRNLSVSSGLSTIGVELRDLNSTSTPGHLGIVGASLGAFPNPGFPALGGNLLIVPDGLFTTTSGVWQSAFLPVTFVFTAEGVATMVQLPIPTTAVGAVLNIQGASLNAITITLDSTNAVVTRLLP
jgi:hypothetical protein